MPRYTVEISRTETITYSVEATSAEDAEARYLMDGEETGSETASLSVESVTEEG